MVIGRGSVPTWVFPMRDLYLPGVSLGELQWATRVVRFSTGLVTTASQGGRGLLILGRSGKVSGKISEWG